MTSFRVRNKTRDHSRQHCRLTICIELVELTNSVSVSDDKIQITILILRRGALSTLDIFTARSSMLGALKRQDSFAASIIEEKRNDPEVVLL